MPESPPAISTLGWNTERATAFAPFEAEGLQPARVAVEDKHHYQLFARDGVYTGKVTGKFRSRTRTQADFPKVGDWVACQPVAGGDRARIHELLPRSTRLARKRKGRETSEQVLVTNVDVAFIVHGLDRHLNVRLIERFLVMTREGGVRPVALLNKSDLDSHTADKVAELKQALGSVPVLPTCARSGRGLDEVMKFVQPGRTVVFMGSSGVGKSSLINSLYGDDVQATAEVRESDAKGRHTTTWREMILLPSGGLVIDTPGMREFHMWLSGEGIHEAFSDIEALSLGCRFTNCRHTSEKNCAVLEAVKSRQLEEQRYQSFLKLRREVEFLEDAHRHRESRSRRRSSRLRRRRLEGETQS